MAHNGGFGSPILQPEEARVVGRLVAEGGARLLLLRLFFFISPPPPQPIQMTDTQSFGLVGVEVAKREVLPPPPPVPIAGNCGA